MKKILLITAIFGLGMTFQSCDDFSTDLEPSFNEDPTPSEIVNEATAEQLIRGWYNTVNAYGGPGLSMTTMADMGTCSWGNAGMRDTSSEPRTAWDNASTYGSGFITESYFNGLYSILFDSNALIASMDAGSATYDNPERSECIARFGQAASLGYLALVFDRVWISDENGGLNNNEAVSPAETLALAMEQLDKAIALAENNSFTVGTEFINGMNLTSAQFAEFLNSFAARLIVNMPRNSAQRDAIDWNSVLAYANNGLSYDLNVTSDGWETWYSAWIYYQIYPGWGRVDMRVVNMMDPSTIDYWTSTDGFLAASTSNDMRLASDFEHLSSQDFIPSRGIYHYSNYRHARWDGEAHGSNWTGATPEMLKAENDLYKAEAQMRTGNLAGAAGTINAGSRSTRGGLAAITADATEIAGAIHYERSIELMNTGMGLGFFEMRRENMLQAGTFLHFPVPGVSLEAAMIPNYTFGAGVGVAGEDYSVSGWND